MWREGAKNPLVSQRSENRNETKIGAWYVQSMYHAEKTGYIIK